MATLYVENLPEDLYDAIRRRARSNRRSIAAEVISVLERAVPTQKEIRRRQKLFREIQQLYAGKPHSGRLFPTAEEMIREDRAR